MNDKYTAELGKTGLARCGAETARQLKAAKSDVDLIALFRGKGDDTISTLPWGCARGWRNFGGRPRPTWSRFSAILRLPGTRCVTRTAAKALLHLGPEQIEHAEILNNKYVFMKDENTAKDLAKILHNMGLQAGPGRFQSSLLLHAKVRRRQKNRIISDLLKKENFSSSEPTNLTYFGRVADSKAKEMVIDRWLEENKGKFVKDRQGESDAAKTYTNEALFLCTYFRGDAKKLAPILADDLQDYAKSVKVAFSPSTAAEALGYIGAVPGVDIRKALELASRARPLGDQQFEDKVRAAAKDARISFPIEPPFSVFPRKTRAPAV